MTLYWLKKVELSGKRVVRNGVSFSNSWEKNKLHCGNTVCEHIHPKEPNGSGMLLAISSLIDDAFL